MDERQLGGVKKGPLDRQAETGTAITIITDDGVFDGREVRPYLVGATGLQPALDQRASRSDEALDDAVVGSCRLAVGDDRPPRRVAR